MRTIQHIHPVKHFLIKVFAWRISPFFLFFRIINPNLFVFPFWVFVSSNLSAEKIFPTAALPSYIEQALPPLIQQGETVKKGQIWYNEHVGGICSSSFNKQGNLLAITSTGKPIELWDVSKRKLMTTFFGGSKGESAFVDLSPNGNLLAFSIDGRVELRNMKTRELLFSIPVIDGGLSVLSKNGRYLASAIDGKRVDLWDTKKQQRAHSFLENKQEITALAFSDDGRYLVAANKDGLINVWDIIEKIFMYELDGHQAAVTSLVFSADSKRFVTADSSGETRVWGIERAELLHQLTQPLGNKGDFSTALTISPNGKKLLRVLNSVSNNVKNVNVDMFDLLKGKRLFSLAPLHVPVRSLAFLPDNRLVAFSFNNKVVKLFDSSSQHFVDTFGGQLLKARQVTISPDGKVIAVGTVDGVLQFWDFNRKFLKYSLKGHKESIEQVAFSSDAQFIVVGDDKGGIMLWDRNRKQVTWSVKAHQKGRTVFAISPDNRFLLTATTEASVMTLWDINAQRPVSQFRGHHAGITGIAYTADGKRAVSSSNDGTVKLWDVKTHHIIHSFDSGSRSKKFTALDLSRDGRYLAVGVNASGSDVHGIEIWALDSFEQRYSLNDHFKKVTAVQFSPDSRQLVSASEDGSIKIWSLKGGDLLASLHKRKRVGKIPAPVYSVTFTKNGHNIISVDAEGGVNNWNIRSRRLVHTMIGGPRGTWISENHLKKRFWRGDDGSLIATRNKSVSPQAVAPSGLAAKDTLVITTSRKELEVPEEGGKVRITVNNRGRNPSFWIRVRQRDNKNTPVTLLPNKLMNLAAGQTGVMDVQFITHDLDFVKRKNRIKLRLELITKAGSTFPIEVMVKLVKSSPLGKNDGGRNKYNQ